MSRASMSFLKRQRVFIPVVQHMPMFAGCCLKSHLRPIRPAMGLVSADHPWNRMVTQKEEDRVPYACCKKVPPSQGGCC